MFTKSALLAVLSIAILATALPNLAQAQYMELFNDSGTPESSANTWFDDIAACVLVGPTDSFLVDSVHFCWYWAAGDTQNLDYVIKVYDANGTVPYTNCGSGGICTNGPGTELYSSPDDPAYQEVNPGAAGFYWFTHAVNPPDGVETEGEFLIAIQIKTSGDSTPSYSWDDNAPTACCVDYFHWGSWKEQWDAWRDPSEIGYLMIRAKGTAHGASTEPTLRITPDNLFFGHASIPWAGSGAESIKQEGVLLTNIGGEDDTITAITVTNPDFYWDNGPTLPYVLGPGASTTLDVTFQTTTEGNRMGTLDITHTGENATATVYTVNLSGIGYNGHWLENFYEGTAWDPVCGSWGVQRDSTLDEEEWLIYGGGYSSQGYMMGHQYTDPDSFVVDWRASSPLRNPDNAGAQVSWMQRCQWPGDYDFNGFYWTSPDCSHYYFIDEIPPTAENEWIDEGPHFIIDCVTDSVGIAFLYTGAYADNWFIDDIRIDSLPQLPPVITHEHHCDVTDNFIHVTAHVQDPNNDGMTVLLYYTDDQTHTWASVAMTPVTGCEYNNLYEAMVPSLTSCCRYGYYFSATDPGGSGQTTLLPTTAPTEHYHVDIMSTPSEIAYDDGEDWYGNISFSWWQCWAVRFTPPSYPYYLGGAHFKAPNNWPDGDHQDMVFEVYDDNGADNLPGTLLYGPDETGMCWNLGVNACDDTSFNSWYYVKFCPCIEITEGDFYIAMRNLTGAEYPELEGVAFDSDGPSGTSYPDYRTYIFYPDEIPGSGSWNIDTSYFNPPPPDPPVPHSDLILRAVECGIVDPSDLTVIEDGTGNVELNWTPSACGHDVYRAADMDDPAWPGDFSLIASNVQPPYQDVLGTEQKALYVVAGACDPTVEPPSMTIPTDIGPMRYADYYKTASHKVGEAWSPLTKGAMPKRISKEALKKGMKFHRTTKTSWSTAK